ncbi:MAG TPA: trypsin-like serine protease [Planctomycetes bacterium]|nr:trypsin-like serine protease [Planctomycetota bacterium]
MSFCFRSLILFACFVPSLAAQVVQHPSKKVPLHLDSGVRANPLLLPKRIYSQTIEVPGALWLRLEFDKRTRLEGESILRITSIEDGAVQFFQAKSLSDYAYLSAFFNGSSVRLDLLAAGRTFGNRVLVRFAEAGTIPSPGRPTTICGPTDDRKPSKDPRVARQYPTGCTTWLISAYAGLTAGHCTRNTRQMMHFNVPLSSSSGRIRLPGPQDQYAYVASSVLRLSSGVGRDWSVFRVVRNSNTGLYPGEKQGSWFKLGKIPSKGNIRITGHGVSYVNRPRSQTQQTHFGPLVRVASTYLGYRVDTTGGNSGSPVIDEATGHAVGIHTHGGCRSSGSTSFNYGTRVDRSDLQKAIQAVLNQVVLAIYQPFGKGCSGTAGIPSLVKVQTPELGGALKVSATNLPGSSWLMFGSSKSKWLGLTLPFSLTGAGAPGCSVLVSFDLYAAPLSVVSGKAQFNQAIPNDKRLLGIRFYNQVLSLDSRANRLGLVLSNGAEGVIGGLR